MPQFKEQISKTISDAIDAVAKGDLEAAGEMVKSAIVDIAKTEVVPSMTGIPYQPEEAPAPDETDLT